MRQKKCKQCGQEKSIRHFHVAKKSADGRQYYCKPCVKERGRAYYLAHPDRVLNANKRWAHKNPEAKRQILRKWRSENRERTREQARVWRLKNKEKILKIQKKYREKFPERSLAYRLKAFGLSISDYNKMLLAQSNTCAGCLNPPKKKRLHIDHNHSTGRIRGLLCKNCNLSIGMLKDNVETLKRLATYLEKDKSEIIQCLKIL